MRRQLFILTACILLMVSALPLAAAPPAGRTMGWEGLVERHDLDGDGVITAEEFGASDRRFIGLDQDGDGVITEADVEAVRAEARASAGTRVVVLADADRDRIVTTQEWLAFLAALDPDGDGTFETEDLRAVAEAQFGARGEGRGGRGGPRGFRGRGPRGGDSETDGPGAGGPGDGFASILDRDQNGVLEITDLDDIFFQLDSDGDGDLSSDELPEPRFRGRGRRGFGSGGGGVGGQQ